MHKHRDKPLRVCALGFDSRSYTALQFFFRDKCGNKAVLVGDDEAEVGIIDMDSFNARKVYASQRELHPGRPLILLSLDEGTPLPPNAVHIKKPVQIQAMLSALDQVQQLSISAGSETIPDKRPEAEPVIQPQPAETNPKDAPGSGVLASPQAERLEAERKTAGYAATLLDERGFGDYIGSLKDIDPSNPVEVKAAQYDPKRFLQGYLQAACKIAVEKNCAMRLDTGWKPIIIFPQSRDVWVDADEQQLRSFCLVPVHSISELGFGSSDSAVMKIVPASTKRLQDSDFDPAKLQRMDALLWKVALWTSAGRVPEDIDLAHPVYLRHWPNFTRLLIFPHALRIASLMSEQSRSLPDIAETLNVRQQYVFAFFSAARALGLADQTHRRSETLIAPAPVEPRKNAGLLRKILQRLIGR